MVAIDYDCVTNIHIAQNNLFKHFYYFQTDFAYIADRRIHATDPLDLNSWLVLLMHKSELILDDLLDFYRLLCLYNSGVHLASSALCLRKSTYLFLSD